MKTITLGRSGLEVPRIAFGTWQLGGDWARVNGVKLYTDGSLGARTAALREPYADDPSNSGMLRYSDEQLSEVVGLADSKGYQVIIHAIGDRAVEQAVTALAGVTGGELIVKDTVTEDLRMIRLVFDRLGLRTVMGGPNVVRGGSHSGNVAAADLARDGLLDVLSSDYVPASLLGGVFALHHRHGIALPRAVAMVSRNPAEAVGLPDRGRLVPGMRADLVWVRPLALSDGTVHPVVRAVWRQGRRVVWA